MRSTMGCKTHTVVKGGCGNVTVRINRGARRSVRAWGGCETRGPSGGERQQLVPL